MKRVLIVDDDVAVTNYLMVFLMQTEIYESEVVNDSRQVPELLDREAFDVMLLDMNMPGLSGPDVLKLLQERNLQLPVIVLTGFSDVELAVKAMKLGAFDYLTKPVEDEVLLEVLAKAIDHRALHSSIAQLPSEPKREDLARRENFEQLPTVDPAMIRLFAQVEKLAESHFSIFIQAERGSMAALLAEAIHRASPYRDGPFVHVDLPAYDPELLPAVFFGRAPDWSGTREEQPGLLEKAEHGTLFLYCIEDLPAPMQARLLRVIHAGEYYRESSSQVRKIQLRIIASSPVDLSGDEYRDRFSPELIYHLRVNAIRIPPLRERPDDIPLLAGGILEQEGRRQGKPIREISPELMALLQGYRFPGNMKELQQIISSAVAGEETGRLTPEALTRYVYERLRQGG